MSLNLTKDKLLINSLKKLGLKKGDTVLVHSDISKLGIKKLSIKNSMELIYNTIVSIIGKSGTLCVPAFYFEFNKKKFFDPKKTSVTPEIGLFSRYIVSLKKSKRSINPIASIAAVGKNAKKICNNKTASAYGEDSPFDILTKLNAKMLFLGADLRYMTYVHYVEQRVGVPHRYFKLFNGKVILNKKKIDLPIIGFVRYLKNDIINDIEGNNIKFSNKNLMKKIKFKKIFLYLLETKKTYNFLKEKLQKDCFYLLKKKPKL